jgi:hypothetical protein
VKGLKGGQIIRHDHSQTTVFYPGEQDFIEVDEGIALLLQSLWDAKIRTCNSCQENEPGIIWIEFYSMGDVERLLTIIIRSLGDRIQTHPEINDWLCYRILGYEGERLKPWHFDAYPNLSSTKPNQTGIYPKKIFDSKIELSVSARFPCEDKQMVFDLVSKYLRKGLDSFAELSDDKWNYIKQYIPAQPYSWNIKTDDRKIIDGIRYALETGCPWKEVPRKYGSYLSIHGRLKRWSSEGVLEPILNSIGGDESYKDRLSNYLTTSNDHMTSKRKRSTDDVTCTTGEMAQMSLSE